MFNFLREKESFYIFDKNTLISNIRNLINFEKDFNSQFILAVKSNQIKEYINYFFKYNVGYDVSNLREFNFIKKFLNKDSIISVTGPFLLSFNKRIIQQNKNLNIIFNADSQLQLRKIKEFIHWNKANNIVIGIRVNINSFTRKIVINPRISRFGIIDIKNLTPEFIINNNISCIHLHFVGEKNMETFVYIFNKLKDIINNKKCKKIIKYINFGGFENYFQDGNFEQLRTILIKSREFIPFNIKIIFEPGQFWFKNAISIVSTIIDIKYNILKDSPIIILNISSECHLKWSNPRINFVNDLLKNNNKENSNVFFVKCPVFGNTCYESDFIGFLYIEKNIINDFNKLINQKVLLEDINIYSVSWNHEFNGIKKLKIIEK